MSPFQVPPQAAFELKLVFLRELEENHRRAQPAVEALAKTPSDAASLSEVRAFFHKLAGTAAAVDLALLGQLAAVCERAADLLRDGAVRDPAAAVAMLSEGMLGVASVLRSHGSGAGAAAGARATSPALSAPAPSGSEPSKILVVDDDPFSANLVTTTLRSAGFVSSPCTDSSQAFAAIEAERPDLIILDVDMPVIDGLALCRRVRAHPGMQLTPILFVTRRSDANQRVAGLEAGGNDYIAKPFDPRELVARVRSHLQRLFALEDMAVRDGLTRCFNHHYFKMRLEQEVARSRRYGSPMSLVMFDVDHFKRVNDTYGHPAGDAVLAQLAGLALASVRSSDVVARYGGEEFAILLIEAGAREASIVANRFRERVAAHAVLHQGAGAASSVELRVTVSAGVAELWAGESMPSLLQRADGALYQAKAGGRNQIRLAPEDWNRP
jgi:diguanylate cyclase (GGDEF)-like protein